MKAKQDDGFTPEEMMKLAQMFLAPQQGQQQPQGPMGPMAQGMGQQMQPQMGQMPSFVPQQGQPGMGQGAPGQGQGMGLSNLGVTPEMLQQLIWRMQNGRQ